MTDHHTGPPPAAACTDDHAFAAWAATVAGELLLRVRQGGLEGPEVKDAGDRAAHELLVRLLAENRPADAVLSEEAADDKARLRSQRVWIIAMGSAGVKVMSVVRDVADAYVHAGGQYEWDSAAPVAVARAAGLHASRVDGSPLEYNRDEVLLPDLVVCRPELAERIIRVVAAQPVTH